MMKCMLNCNGKQYAKGFCEKHYRRWKRGTGHWKSYLDLDKCVVSELCTNKIYAKGLCKNHYQQWKRAINGCRVRKTGKLTWYTPDNESDYD